jgi:uncharacterized membrane protein
VKTLMVAPMVPAQAGANRTGGAAAAPNPRRRPTGAPSRRLLVHLPVALLVVAYVVRFGLLSVQVYDGYASPGYDMGVFDQGVWLLSRFHAPFVTVMGRDLFGDHTSFILLLAVPLYWVWPHAQTLLLLQTLLLAGAAVPIYLMARRRVQGVWMPTALAGAYLLNPALQWGNLEQFHPDSFLAPLAALAVFAAIEWKPRLLVVAVVAALLVKEDAAALVVPLGLWVLARRDRRLGLAIVAGAVAWTAFAFLVVIRSLLGTASFYANRIPFGGVAGLLAAPFIHPAKLASYLAGGGRPYYVWQMGASFAWMFATSPQVAAVGLGVLAENVISSFGYMHQIYYHYSFALVAVLAAGTVFAVGRIAGQRRQAAATAVVACAAVASCVVWGLAPFSLSSYPHHDPSGPTVTAINRELRLVPADAVVSASYQYVAHLDHRTGAYQWPTPFRAHYWGLYREEGRRLPEASSVEYLVIPTHLSGSGAATFAAIRREFALVGSGGGVSVYRRVR